MGYRRFCVVTAVLASLRKRSRALGVSCFRVLSPRSGRCMRFGFRDGRTAAVVATSDYFTYDTGVGETDFGADRPGQHRPGQSWRVAFANSVFDAVGYTGTSDLAPQ